MKGACKQENYYYVDKTEIYRKVGRIARNNKIKEQSYCMVRFNFPVTDTLTEEATIRGFKMLHHQ